MPDDTKDAEINAAIERMVDAEPGSLVNFVTREDRITAALKLVAEVTDLASAKAREVEDATMTCELKASSTFYVKKRTDEYHAICVDLHQACYEWLVIRNQS